MGRSNCRRRGAHRRLSDLHMDDAAALGFEPCGGGHDVHDHERRHGAARGWLQQALGLVEHRFAFTFRNLPSRCRPGAAAFAGFLAARLGRG